MTEQARPGALFRAATAPARWLSRYRTDLGASLREDAATFAGPATRFFLVLAVLAVAYPIIASVAHAQAPAPPRADPITYAFSPFFFQAFAESQTFMIAAFAIGAFSPGLGVLFIAVFLPADLMAAAVHCGGCGSGGPPELRAPQNMEMWQGPIAARLISYALLWILAVEIPLRVRRWATAWAGRAGRQPSVLVSAAAVMAGTAVLAFFWVRALPALISPVFNWTVLRESIEATNATWDLWPIFVIATTAIAGVAATWPRPLRVLSDPAALAPAARGSVRSVGRTVVRQTVAVLLLTALLAGLVTDLLEAAILIGALLAAGPLVTLVLPRLRVPRWLPPARSLTRWITAMVIALAVSRLMLTLTLDTIESPNLVLVLSLAVAAPLFRLLLEAGATQSAAADMHGAPPGPPRAVITSTIVVLAVVLWLMLPTLVLADNWWSDRGELKDALKKAWDFNVALIGGALAVIGGLLATSPPIDNPNEFPPFIGPPTPAHNENWKAQASPYDPSGFRD